MQGLRVVGLGCRVQGFSLVPYPWSCKQCLVEKLLLPRPDIEVILCTHDSTLNPLILSPKAYSIRRSTLPTDGRFSARPADNSVALLGFKFDAACHGEVSGFRFRVWGLD